jgi:hypothetical protein
MRKIFYGTKTGRGLATKMYGRHRAVHHIQKGGELLLMPGLGASSNEGMSLGGGVNAKSDRLDALEKQPMQNIVDRLNNIQFRTGKKKNISFMI